MNDKTIDNRFKDIITKIQLFRGINPESLEKFKNHFTEKKVLKNDIILSPDKKNKDIYILISGLLHVHLSSVNSHLLDRVDPGECVGEMSMLDENQPSAFVIAAQDSNLLIINKKIFRKMTNQINSIAQNLLYLLISRIRHGHSAILDTQEHEKKNELLANIDPLTGLHNRRWFDKKFNSEIIRSDTMGHTVSIIMADIDHFKLVNDEHGHLTGDKALCAVGEIIRKSLRPHDMIARFGGEEFCILLPETKQSIALKIAERIRTNIMKLAIYAEDTGKKISITMSLGVSEHVPDQNFKNLLTKVDKALYKAKNEGRNLVKA